LTDRDRVYIQNLHVGLMALHNVANAGDVEYWQIESDHLHNLPSLIGEPNEHRHDYYFNGERTLYLERVKDTNHFTKFTLARYAELWAQLENLKSQK
jgi:hypothetical protein